MKVITKNLTLQSIEANNWEYDEYDIERTICWALFFSFHGIDGFSAFITDNHINDQYASFAMIESDEGDLHESFANQIEENWSAIIEEVKKWEDQNIKEQTGQMV